MEASIYNRLLDISTVIHIISKVLAIYVVHRHSPTNMDSFPLFILNVMIWNLAGNVFGALIHMYPLFPDDCFRADGLASVFVQSERISHFLYALVVVCVGNCALASVFAFPYRYLVFVHPRLVSNIKRRWCSVLCAVAHACMTASILYVYTYLIIPFDDYAFRGERPPRKGVFCFQTRGWIKYFIGAFGAVVMSGLVAVVISSAVLLRRHLESMSHIYSACTLDLHRKYFRYLLVITAVPVVFCEIPILIAFLCAFYSEFEYSKEVFTSCAVVIYNHGTLFSAVTIITFRPYYRSVSRMVHGLFIKCRHGNRVFVSK
ncbi:hypothetical protein QR680_016477 [Steinernema hermaphroditum]|uniref:Uncharacterized protein n=1 Tax=Steinernema hermaphroditum TaxID=289476 RepID=A0AA39HCB9_9BILA|nr:hypothetical protein QR680_016477 [Steinernema hermaphroditum]